jgi:hypothetical protein
VSTPSRSSRRFLSVLPFNLQFRGCPIDFPSPSLFLSFCCVPINIRWLVLFVHAVNRWFNLVLPCGCLWPSSTCCAPCWLPVPHVKIELSGRELLDLFRPFQTRERRRCPPCT